ncbi:MAG: hypothetical protein HOW73_08095 [Polyangiaceae bacterium]|nr:hypothetical protein [Polyangiaceae bacterium]
MIGAVSASLFFSSAALADTQQECGDSYLKTQDLQDAGKLEEAIEQAQICSQACPKLTSRAAKEMTSDCAKWQTDLESRTSSIIVEVVDAAGKPVTEGSISLDGEPWLEKLDSAAHGLSKGPHTLKINVKDADPHTEGIVVKEGEKDRKIKITLPGAEPPPAEYSIAPWIIGGAGVAVLLASAVTGGLVIYDYNVMNKNCNEVTGCEPDGEEAVARGQVLGPVTTGLLVGGGALVAAGVIWLVVERTGGEEPSKTSFFVAPIISSDQKGVALGGSW